VTLINELFPDATHHTYNACSGTLVDSHLVLTAAHCLTNFGGYVAVRSFVLFARHVDYLGFLESGETGVASRRVAQYIPHPLYGQAPDATYDIGLLRFEGDIPAGYSIVRLAHRQPHGHERIALVGFGFTGWQSGDAGVLRRVLTRVARIERPEHRFETQTPGHTSCSGDSGGPAFLTPQRHPSQVGVISYTADDCSSTAGATLVPDFLPWLREQGVAPR
jgi:hypothetical protein